VFVSLTNHSQTYTIPRYVTTLPAVRSNHKGTADKGAPTQVQRGKSVEVIVNLREDDTFAFSHNTVDDSHKHPCYNAHDDLSVSSLSHTITTRPSIVPGDTNSQVDAEFAANNTLTMLDNTFAVMPQRRPALLGNAAGPTVSFNAESHADSDRCPADWMDARLEITGDTHRRSVSVFDGSAPVTVHEGGGGGGVASASSAKHNKHVDDDEETYVVGGDATADAGGATVAVERHINGASRQTATSPVVSRWESPTHGWSFAD
jgi:hypothetical protein